MLEELLTLGPGASLIVLSRPFPTSPTATLSKGAVDRSEPRLSPNLAECSTLEGYTDVRWEGGYGIKSADFKNIILVLFYQSIDSGSCTY